MELRIVFAMMFLGFAVNAQREQYVRPGLITTSMTISPSLMLNHPENNYYLSGYLEGRVDQRLSFRGETFYFIDGSEDTPMLRFSCRTFFGTLYHLNKGNFDSHIGFMPGLSVMQFNGDLNASGDMPYRVVPSMAANIGATYYIWKFFNFFANVTYIHSTAHALTNQRGRTDEILISAGLGLNINAVKAK